MKTIPYPDTRTAVFQNNQMRIKDKLFTGKMEFPDGSYECFVDGYLHCNDGPAAQIYYDDGFVIKKFYLLGEPLTFQDFWEKQKNTIYASTILAHFLGDITK